jgi:hypothetical protein
LNNREITKILINTELAQFGDALLNFAYSTAVTQTSGHPQGVKVSDRILASAAVKAGLRKLLPRRVDRGDVANSVEALLGHAWLAKAISLDEIVNYLKPESLDPAENFCRLAALALSKLEK